MANFCGSCGAGLNPNAKFCNGCGRPITAAKPMCPTCGQDMPQQPASSAPSSFVGAHVAQPAAQANPPVGTQAPLGNPAFHMPLYGKEFVAGQHCGNCGFDVQGNACARCGTGDITPLN